MLSILTQPRHFATIVPGKVHDLRQLLAVGDAIQATAPLIQSPNVSPASQDFLKTKILEQIERLTAGFIERQAGANHETAGFCVTVKEHKPASTATQCTLTAEVTEVTPSQAMFRVEVLDGSNGALISSADYSRVITEQPYRFKY